MSIFNSLWNTFFKNGFSIFNGYGHFSSEEYISKIYENPSFVLAESKKTKAAKAVQWGVFKLDAQGNQERIKNHVLDKMFLMPNKNCTWGEFLEYWTVWYDAKDNGVLLEKVVGLPTIRPELKLWNPDNFTVYMNGVDIDKIEITNPVRHIVGEELENFMWIRQPNFYNDMAGSDATDVQTGHSNQRAMALPGSYVYNSWRWNNSIVKNMGKRSGVYTSEKPLPPDERKKLEQKIDNGNSLDNKGKDILASGNLKFSATDIEMQDADWGNGETKAHDRIVSSVGVAPELTGSGNSTYSNRAEARKELYQEEIIPGSKDKADRLNIFLEAWLKPGEFIGIDVGSIMALRTEIGEAIKALEGAKNRLTVDEYRAELSRLTGQDLPAISTALLVNSSEMPLDDLLNTEVEPEPDTEE